jgi:hypothetical protein
MLVVAKAQQQQAPAAQSSAQFDRQITVSLVTSFGAGHLNES